MSDGQHNINSLKLQNIFKCVMMDMSCYCSTVHCTTFHNFSGASFYSLPSISDRFPLLFSANETHKDLDREGWRSHFLANKQMTQSGQLKSLQSNCGRCINYLNDRLERQMATEKKINKLPFLKCFHQGAL